MGDQLKVVQAWAWVVTIEVVRFEIYFQGRANKIS